MSLATLAGSSCITHGAPEAHLVIPYIACILSIGMRKEKYWSASLHGYYHASLLRIVHSSLCSTHPSQTPDALWFSMGHVSLSSNPQSPIRGRRP